MNGSLQLSEYPDDIVRLSCEKCVRSGQYRKQKLIERYGGDMRLPDLRQEIAQCRRHGQMHDACMVRYVDLVPPVF
jgi:IS1 family transposase